MLAGTTIWFGDGLNRIEARRTVACRRHLWYCDICEDQRNRSVFSREQ